MDLIVVDLDISDNLAIWTLLGTFSRLGVSSISSLLDILGFEVQIVIATRLEDHVTNVNTIDINIKLSLLWLLLIKKL